MAGIIYCDDMQLYVTKANRKYTVILRTLIKKRNRTPNFLPIKKFAIHCIEPEGIHALFQIESHPLLENKSYVVPTSIELLILLHGGITTLSFSFQVFWNLRGFIIGVTLRYVTMRIRYPN